MSRAKPSHWKLQPEAPSDSTVYLSDTGWKVMDLSVATDKIFEKAEGYR